MNEQIILDNISIMSLINENINLKNELNYQNNRISSLIQEKELLQYIIDTLKELLKGDSNE